jgi:hypothetical protein
MQQEAEGFSASRQELGAWKMWIVTRCRLQAPIVNFALSQNDDVEAQSMKLRRENRPFSLKTVVLEADARHAKRFRVLHHREGERKTHQNTAATQQPKAPNLHVKARANCPNQPTSHSYAPVELAYQVVGTTR